MDSIKASTWRQSKSQLEIILMLQIRDHPEIPAPVREYRFDDKRRWRFDFAWPDQQLAAEVEGGTWGNKSRHTTGTGFHNDCEKYNTATVQGWRVFRFDAKMVNDLTAINVLLDQSQSFRQS